MKIYNEGKWIEKIVRTLYLVYVKAPFYKLYIGMLEKVFYEKYDRLVGLNVSLIRVLYRILGMEDNLILSSDLGVKLARDDKLNEICVKLEATVYLANNGSKPYINQSKFQKKNIGFVFQDYEHPVYDARLYNFHKYLSVLDPIFWHGPKSLEIILKGRNNNWKEGII